LADLRGKDRLIVALDVPTHARAFELVDQLDNVSFFKVGLGLFLQGDVLGFIKKLQERRAGEGGVFVDLKLSGDIGNTITNFVEGCAALNVRFITLVESNPLAITVSTLRAARQARGSAQYPHFLMVPFFSSLDTDDLRQVGIQKSATEYIVERGLDMLSYGCDGLIVSGDAIKACRDAFGPSIDIVSPGIRPTWATADDQKRITTPTQAIKFGSDYLVVGRPITNNDNPRRAAQMVIDEIDAALDERDTEADRPRLLSKVG
jgi:orotidine-5'-phosphate decarboxylase